MRILLWIVQVLLALLFIFSGAMKFVMSVAEMNQQAPVVLPGLFLHFIGLCFLFGVVLIVNLRMLGIGKTMLSFAALHQLLPLGMLGFALNLTTGMVFFIAAPQQYTTNPVFYWKVVFILLAGINVLYFMLMDEPWRVEAGEDAPLRAKLVAASAIFLWVGILFFGHMLPFLGNAF